MRNFKGAAKILQRGVGIFSQPRLTNFPKTDSSFILLSRLLFITEGKYWNQLKKFRKFRVVLSSGGHETGGTAKKVTASDSAKPGPHIHIYFFDLGVTGTCRNGDKE